MADDQRLFTTCPQCKEAFAIDGEALALAGGQSRCGLCGTVFDGLACAKPLWPAELASMANAIPPAESNEVDFGAQLEWALGLSRADDSGSNDSRRSTGAQEDALAVEEPLEGDGLGSRPVDEFDHVETPKGFQAAIEAPGEGAPLQSVFLAEPSEEAPRIELSTGAQEDSVESSDRQGEEPWAARDGSAFPLDPSIPLAEASEPSEILARKTPFAQEPQEHLAKELAPNASQDALASEEQARREESSEPLGMGAGLLEQVDDAKDKEPAGARSGGLQAEPILFAPAPAEPWPRFLAKGALLAALAGGLGLQLGYGHREDIAARAPWLREPLGAVCGWFGCSVGLAQARQEVSLEDPDVSIDPDGLLRFTATLKNGASFDSAAPKLWLSVEGPGGESMASRAFEPKEWAGGDVLDAQSEREVRLTFPPPQTAPASFKATLEWPAPKR